MSDIGRRVVCAANRGYSNKQIVLGVRHHDSIMNNQIDHSKHVVWEQGFIDNKGNFLTREEAYTVAFDAGQIIRRCGGDEGRLFSENLY